MPRQQIAGVPSATGTDDGLLIRTDAVTDVTVSTATLSGWELVNTNNSNKLLFRDSQDYGYTDYNNQGRGIVWNITKTNGVYRLQTAAGDPTYAAAALQYAGANADIDSKRVYFGYNSSSSDIDWLFLTAEQKNAANIVARARLYRALMKAYAAGVNTESASAVYESSESTEEQLNSAVTSLNSACLAAHLANASNTDPRDITEYVLSNTDFTQGNITGWETNYVSGTQATNIGYQNNNTYNSADGFCNRFIEAWRSNHAKIGDGYLRQTVSGMPEGKYVLECDAIATNQGNTSATTTGALLYINADGIDFTTSLSTTGSAVQHFSTEFLFSGEGDVIFGLKTQSTTANWIAADNFKVTFYGIDLSAYVTQLATAVSDFEALDGKVPATTYANKKSTIVDVNNKEWTSSKEYIAAIAAVQGATNDLTPLQAEYANYKAIRANVVAAYNSTDLTAADAAADAATTAAEITAAEGTARAALLSALTTNNLENINLTAAILINPSFETGDFTGWTNTGMATQDNTSFTTKDGTYYAECWQPNGTKSLTQTVSGLAAGVYRVTAKIVARGVTSAKFSAGGVEKTMTIEDAINTYTIEFACEANAEAAIKYEGVGTGAGSSWLCIDDVTLTYVGALPELTAITGKMNAEVAAAQSSAISTYNTTKTAANYNAAMTAINNAQTSVDAYAIAAKALTDANVLKEAHNFASEAAATTFAAAIADAQSAYDNTTMTDADAAAGANLGVTVTGWHAGNNTPAAVYMRDGFSLGDFDVDLHINTWSAEGASDGSNFVVPFYEYWTADANSLGEKTWTGTLSDLPNGQYKISAWVRAKAKNETAATDATGITMYVNDGDAVDVTEGTQIGSTLFQQGTYEALGLVKDGNLSLNFAIAADNNVSWLAIKNVKYTKVRDLNEEEQATIASATDYENLNKAINSHVIGFEDGEYAPYNNVEGAAAIAAAKAINQDSYNATADVQAAIAAINDATWKANDGEVNAIYDGSFTIQTVPTENTRPLGWARHSATANSNDGTDGGYETRLMTLVSGITDSNQGMMTKYHTFYGDQAGYALPLKANTYYVLSFKYAGWGNTPTMHVNVYNEEGTRVAQSANFTAKDNAGDKSADSWTEYSYTFKTTIAGNYVIGLIKNSGGANQDQAGFTELALYTLPSIELSEAASYTPEATTANVKLTKTIYEGFNTVVLPFDMTADEVTSTLGAGTLYSYTGNTDGTLSFETADAITAHTPYLFKADADKQLTDAEVSNRTITVPDNALTSAGTDFSLVGTYTAYAKDADENPIVVGTDYILGADNNFHKTTVKNALKPFRAYLKGNGTQDAGVKALIINLDGVATAIQTIEGEAAAQSDVIYNLAGQRVQKAQHGIYIVGGKKVAVK